MRTILHHRPSEEKRGRSGRISRARRSSCSLGERHDHSGSGFERSKVRVHRLAANTLTKARCVRCYRIRSPTRLPWTERESRGSHPIHGVFSGARDLLEPCVSTVSSSVCTVSSVADRRFRSVRKCVTGCSYDRCRFGVRYYVVRSTVPIQPGGDTTDRPGPSL